LNSVTTGDQLFFASFYSACIAMSPVNTIPPSYNVFAGVQIQQTALMYQLWSR